MTNDGKEGGLLKGKTHEEGGIKAIVTDTGQPVELETDEGIINKKTMNDIEEITVTGTPREIASAINSHKGHGVAFDEGAEITYADGTVKKMEQGGEIHATPEYKDGGEIADLKATIAGLEILGTPEAKESVAGLKLLLPDQYSLFKEGGNIPQRSGKNAYDYGSDEEKDLPFLIYNFDEETKLFNTKGIKLRSERNLNQRQIIANELQHVTQITEGMGGGYPRQEQYNRYIKDHGIDRPTEGSPAYRKLRKIASKLNVGSSGEREAISTAKRLELDAKQRKETPPYSDSDFTDYDFLDYEEKPKLFQDGGTIVSPSPIAVNTGLTHPKTGSIIILPE